MRPAKSTRPRFAAFAPCAALALIVSACDGSGAGYRSPTAPPVPTAPAPVPAPGSLPASDDATPGTYKRVTPHFPGSVEFHGGSLEERYVVAADGTFRLQYESALYGFFEYLGTYARAESWYGFEFDSNDGSPEALASFRGDCVIVEYDLNMQMSDFESGEYCRSAAP